MTKILEFRRSLDTKLRTQELAESLFQQGLEAQETSGDLAVNLYRQVLDFDPAAVGAWVNLGVISWWRHDIASAEQCFRKALETNPRYPLAHYNLACCLDNMGKRDEALEHYLKAVALKPTYADAHFNLADLYEKMGEWRKAAVHYRSFLKYEGDSMWRMIASSRLSYLERQELSLVSTGTGGR